MVAILICCLINFQFSIFHWKLSWIVLFVVLLFEYSTQRRELLTTSMLFNLMRCIPSNRVVQHEVLVLEMISINPCSTFWVALPNIYYLYCLWQMWRCSEQFLFRVFWVHGSGKRIWNTLLWFCGSLNKLWRYYEWGN